MGEAIGRIQSIAFSPERGLPRPRQQAATLLAGHGILGDHRAGSHPDRALNILDAGRLAALAARGYPVAAGVLGENLVIAGLDLAALSPGSRLRLGETAVARVVKPRSGCARLQAIHPDFPAAAEGHLGLICAVDRGGELRVGDPVVLLAPAAWPAG